jgi:hypothetical protein
MSLSSQPSTFGAPDIRFVLDVIAGTHLGARDRIAMIIPRDYLYPFFNASYTYLQSYEGYLHVRETRLKKLKELKKQ